MTLNRHFLRIFAAATVTLLTLPTHAQSTLFKCTDDKGITHYGETMPPQCAKKDITELNREGRAVRKLNAPLTPEQLKARDDANAKKAADEQKTSDQRQKDLALLGTYGAEREIDVLRDKDIAQIEQRRKFLEGRIVESDARVQKATNQMEFYIAGKSQAAKAKEGKDGKSNAREVPPQIQSEFDRAKNDRNNLDLEIARLDVDKKEIITKYNSEKERFRRLKGGLRPGTILDDKGNVLIDAPIPRRVATPAR
jgi:Domain of unknown function (DUF4124)